MEVGMVVKSAAGRDKGLFMAVISAEGGFARVADGRLRKIEKPKKKNIKHLKVTKTLIDPKDLTNKKLRAFLKAYTEKTNN
jgi:ribosomal protein L14E/L6E/L27E